MPDTPDEITALALAAKSGEEGAAAAFVTATHADVRRFLAHLAGTGGSGASDTDDLVQETYLRAMTALPRFAARSSARTWLLAIARRVAADHIRTLRRSPRMAVRDDWAAAADSAALRPHSGGPHSGGQRFEEAVAVGHLIAALPEQRRAAFVATQILGLSYAEAAEVCDVPVGTIRSRVARAREDLIAALAESQPPGRHLRALG